MKQRCHNPSDAGYKNYGGRGIKVCPSWHDFENFFKWAEPIFDRKLSIDRIDNDRGYSPRNCRWVSRSVQTINSRDKKSASGHRGIREQRGRYVALISANSRRHYLGIFDSLDEALLARRVAEKLLHEPLLEKR